MSGFAAHSVLHAQLQRRPAVEDVLDDFAEALQIRVGFGHDWRNVGRVWIVQVLDSQEFRDP